jgi:hypothetical protein
MAPKLSGPRLSQNASMLAQRLIENIVSEDTISSTQVDFNGIKLEGDDDPNFVLMFDSECFQSAISQYTTRCALAILIVLSREVIACSMSGN